ncbi:MAG: hypothetical protein EPN70_17515 [Paraburkholderia sp.]|nr:MAG: hypothetical protein EPN70_17515 [Paraburkholderia sp.]TAM28133.1 MAG: hypothetical protein EPN59_18405 [Paraburkholderia sp.]
MLLKQQRLGFGDLTCSLAQGSRAVVRPAALLFAHAFARLQWAGLGGETFGSAGIQRRRFANPAQCPLTPFGDGSGLLNLSLEAASCAKHPLVLSKHNPRLKSSALPCATLQPRRPCSMRST